MTPPKEGDVRRRLPAVSRFSQLWAFSRRPEVPLFLRTVAAIAIALDAVLVLALALLLIAALVAVWR